MFIHSLCTFRCTFRLINDTYNDNDNGLPEFLLLYSESCSKSDSLSRSFFSGLPCLILINFHLLFLFFFRSSGEHSRRSGLIFHDWAEAGVLHLRYLKKSFNTFLKLGLEPTLLSTHSNNFVKMITPKSRSLVFHKIIAIIGVLVQALVLKMCQQIWFSRKLAGCVKVGQTRGKLARCTFLGQTFTNDWKIGEEYEEWQSRSVNVQCWRQPLLNHQPVSGSTSWWDMFLDLFTQLSCQSFPVMVWIIGQPLLNHPSGSGSTSWSSCLSEDNHHDGDFHKILEVKGPSYSFWPSGPRWLQTTKHDLAL